MPTADHTADVRAALALAQRAEELLGKNKLGGWDSVLALALTSIAKSLAVIADGALDRPGDRPA